MDYDTEGVVIFIMIIIVSIGWGYIIYELIQ